MEENSKEKKSREVEGKQDATESHRFTEPIKRGMVIEDLGHTRT